MKLTIILTIACLQAAASGFGQSVTLNLKSASLETAFREVERQTGYGFVYGSEQLKKAKPIDISVKDAKLDAVLGLIFRDQPLEYTLSGKYVVVREKAPPPPAIALQSTPPLDIEGRVVGEDGKPVAASIQVKGTGTGTTTNDIGYFSLRQVPADAVLIITGVNIETFEVRVSGRRDLGIITAKRKVTEGQEVKVEVNTGYQKIRPQNFVGSFSQLDSTAYSRRVGMDIIGRLDGTMTGILFDKKGGSLSGMQIRGVSTLNSLSLTQSASSDPLIVVDNFPFHQDLSTINPNDVENITVLKDAAATSIWGAQAGNGVIVITTKKGRYNQPLKLTISSNVTVQEKPDVYYYPQMKVSDFIDAEINLFNKGAYNGDLSAVNLQPPVSPVVELLARRRAGLISAADSATQIDGFRQLDVRRDLDAYAYRPSVTQQHYLQLSAGNSALNYSLSAGYNRSLNNVQHSRVDDQFFITSNAAFRPLKKMELNFGANLTQGMQRSAGLQLPAKIVPYAQLADADGRYLAVANTYRQSYVDTVGGGQLLDWRYRPLEEPGLVDRHDRSGLMQLNASVSYRLTGWLTATGAYQYSAQSGEGSQYLGTASYYTRNLINTFTNLSQTNPELRNPLPVGGILQLAHSAGRTQNGRVQLNGNKVIGKHGITGLVAAEVSNTKNTSGQEALYNYDQGNGSYNGTVDFRNAYPVFGTSGSRQLPQGTIENPYVQVRFVSLLGNLSYTYNNRYSVYGSVRKDGANVFGVNTNRKWNPLWSTGASWDVTRENFYNLKWLPALRLRASYGFTGNPGNGTGIATILYTPAPANITGYPAAYPNDPPNPDLKWEEVRIINVGLDFGLLNNRVTGSFDIYRKRTKDVISRIPVPPNTGISSFITNSADLEGHGFDLSLNSKNLVGKFSWQTAFGLSHAQTVVTRLYLPNSWSAINNVLYNQNAVQGQPLYQLYSYRWAGLDQATGDPRGYLNKQVSTNYTAILKDSIGSQVITGSAIPLYYGFVNNNFGWKGFMLSANITYRLDFYYRKPTIDYSALATGWIGNADYALRWQRPGDEKNTTVPSMTYPLNNDRDKFYRYSEVNALRGDNIRLQDIRLQYSMPEKWLKRTMFKGLQFYLYCNNLNLIIWKKSGERLDPDFVGGNNFTAPVPKTYTAGATINF